MKDNEMIQEQYEYFEGNIRKLDELIGQLELWSDDYTINHKKEEIRLPEYIELHQNLEELKEELVTLLNQQVAQEGKTERLLQEERTIEHRLAEYKVTEAHIHDWIREIKDIYILIAKSPILEKNRVYLEAILKGE